LVILDLGGLWRRDCVTVEFDVYLNCI